jgi:hypothetical protein
MNSPSHIPLPWQVPKLVLVTTVFHFSESCFGAGRHTNVQRGLRVGIEEG